MSFELNIMLKHISVDTAVSTSVKKVFYKWWKNSNNTRALGNSFIRVLNLQLLVFGHLGAAVTTQ